MAKKQEMNYEGTMEDFQSMVVQIMEQAVNKRGYELPLFIACVSRNGQSLVMKVVGGGEPGEVICEHLNGNMYLPIHLMISDCSERSASYVRISQGGGLEWVN